MKEKIIDWVLLKIFGNRFIFNYVVIFLKKVNDLSYDEIMKAVQESQVELTFIIFPRPCVISHRICFFEKMYECHHPDDPSIRLYISKNEYLLSRIKYG